MPPAETVPNADLAWYIRSFFQANPTLAAAPGRRVMAGALVENNGSSFTELGVRRTPARVLRIGRTDVVGDGANLASISLAAGQVDDVPLVTLPNLADPVLDDEAAIAAVLGAYGDTGRAWARAIAGDANRATLFGQTLSQVNRVPAGAPDTRVAVLIAVLRRHFSYDREGRYVAKWQGQSRQFPDDTRPEWRETMLVEPSLTRDEFYLFSVVSGPQADGVFPTTEAVLVLRRVDDTLQADTIWASHRREPAAVADFAFFYASAGTNIEVPATARGSLTPRLASLLGRDGGAQALSSPGGDWVMRDDKLLVFTMIRPGAAVGALPAGAEFLDDPPEAGESAGEDEDALLDGLQGLVRVAACPRDKLVELAALPFIVRVSPVGRKKKCLDLALPAMHQPELLTALGVARGGEGVVIGIVDTGLDATHPCFDGRVEAVWDQVAATDPAFPHPSGRGNNFGRVYSGWSTVLANSIDDDGHGTHVSGIAAGRASGTYTRNGVATAATIVFVRTNWSDDGIRRGVEWIFRQAGTRPCVVNLSLGGVSRIGHDGVDDFSLLIRRNLRRVNPSGSGYTWIQGRAVCAAAGNERGGRWHAQVNSVAPGAIGRLEVEAAQQDPTGVTPLPQLEDFELYCRPTPAGVHGCKVSVRVTVSGVGGAASTRWFRFDPAGREQHDALGLETVFVTNGPPPSGDARGLVYTRHQLVLLSLFNAGPMGITPARYTIEVRNDSTSPIEVHGYRQHTNEGAAVFFANDSDRTQVGSPAVGYGLISVGATVNRNAWMPEGKTLPADQEQKIRSEFDPATNVWVRDVQETVGTIASFSSTGPMRGTRRTLTITAPGSGIFSARSRTPGAYPVSDYGGTFVAKHAIDPLTIEMSGTSMACPMVTGVVACLLQRHPRFTADDIASRLRRAVDTPASGWDTDVDGPGKLNCTKLVI